MVKQTFKEALIGIWEALFPLVGLNLIWVILTILVIPAMPAYAGLNFAINMIAKGEPVGTREFFEGFKKFFWISWKYGVLNLTIYAVAYFNIRFYANYEGFGFVLLQYFFVFLTSLWSMLQIYVFPLLLEQDKPSILQGLRNSGVIFLKFPARSLALCALTSGIVVLSIFVPPLIVLLSGSFLVYLFNWQAIWVLQELGVKPTHKQ